MNFLELQDIFSELANARIKRVNENFLEDGEKCHIAREFFRFPRQYNIPSADNNDNHNNDNNNDNNAIGAGIKTHETQNPTGVCSLFAHYLTITMLHGRGYKNQYDARLSQSPLRRYETTSHVSFSKTLLKDFSIPNPNTPTEGHFIVCRASFFRSRV